MKITNNNLQLVIKEELRSLVREQLGSNKADCVKQYVRIEIMQAARSVILQLMFGTMSTDDDTLNWKPSKSPPGAAWHSGINKDSQRNSPGIEAYKKSLAGLAPCLEFLRKGFESAGARNKMKIAPPEAGGYPVARQVVDALMFQKYPELEDREWGKRCYDVLYNDSGPIEEFKPFEADNWDWGSAQTITTISKAAKKLACELMLFDDGQLKDPRGNPCAAAMQDCPGNMIA